ncbi:MAG: DUF4304 domain-containing protein [Gaiellaceae bacterium]
MVRDELAPRLRDIGFVGSGQTYTLPDTDAWLMIGLQRSKWSDATAVDFTLNLTVALKSLWTERHEERPDFYPRRPGANTDYGDVMWQDRISSVLRDEGLLGASEPEKWWRVQAGEPTEAVTADVLKVVGSYALPAILAMRDKVLSELG